VFHIAHVSKLLCIKFMFLSSYTKSNSMSIGEVVPIPIKLPQK